jgi:two-component system LytT family sensor kinase
MHPATFIGLSILVGVLFALQDWLRLRIWGYHVRLSIELETWGMQYFLWGVICWVLWWRFGASIKKARVASILTRVLPVSIVASVAEEMIWVLCFPDVPLNLPHMAYWHRLAFHLNFDLFYNLVIFWCAFSLLRGVGYYQQFRETERAAAQLEVQLANAQISALRMQLNPHFLFNTMNSISSLMRTDIRAADNMLEQLGSLLRITLQRGDAQLIRLRNEIEFIELYLAMQDQRFGNRVSQSLDIDPELHDALVPAMILQPVVENAYAHGLSKLESGGFLRVEAYREGGRVWLKVVNSGVGLQKGKSDGSSGKGVGLSNVRARLLLHYGADHSFVIRETRRNEVQVMMMLPLQISDSHDEQMTRFGA